MKIGSPADKPPVAPAATGATAPGQAAAKSPAAPAAAEASTQVDISKAASALLSSAGASSAEFDAEKVARMSQAIADGTFKVDPAAIADKLIANAQELLKGTH